MFEKLHLLSQDVPGGSGGLRWRAHPYVRLAGDMPKGPAVFDWSDRQREDLEALWRDPTSDGARERLAADLAVFCDRLGWAPDAEMLDDAERHGIEYLVTLSAVPSELYLLPWEVIRVGATGTYLSDYASTQVRYSVPGLEPRAVGGAPSEPGILFAWSDAGGPVPHDHQGAAIRAAADVGGVMFRELAHVDEARLQAALDASPPSVLHVLCHGSQGSQGEPPQLIWGAGDNPSKITATRLARMLRKHSRAVRLVVLSACGSGDGRGDPLFVGSVAQELHRKGIPSVVSSRYPLTASGSCVLTRALYDKMLREAWSLERALRHTRAELFRVDADGKSHPGDAYGIQLYACDTERFVSDNNVQAERPVLASYPFGTAARPVPTSDPPPAQLTLSLDGDPGLTEQQLIERLRRVSEDGSLTIVIGRRGGREISLSVRTTVDGGQRLLRAWRSRTLQLVLGAVVGTLVLLNGINAAAAAVLTNAGAHAAGSATVATTGRIPTVGAKTVTNPGMALAAVVAVIVVGIVVAASASIAISRSPSSGAGASRALPSAMIDERTVPSDAPAPPLPTDAEQPAAARTIPMMSAREPATQSPGTSSHAAKPSRTAAPQVSGQPKPRRAPPRHPGIVKCNNGVIPELCDNGDTSGGDPCAATCWKEVLHGEAPQSRRPRAVR